MLCFDVRVNGDRVSFAGVDHGVLSTILTATRQPRADSCEVFLNVGGLVQHMHKDWAQTELQIGDRIEVLLLEGEPDPPMRERKEDEALRDNAEAERRYYERLKQKYEPETPA
jgi:hypothetical protein